VDSQDSLWKVTHVPNEGLSQQPHHTHHHGNYEHYAPPEESYIPCEARNNYVTDPYGPIPKPKRRLDLIGKSSVRGMPIEYVSCFCGLCDSQIGNFYLQVIIHRTMT